MTFDQHAKITGVPSHAKSVNQARSVTKRFGVLWDSCCLDLASPFAWVFGLPSAGDSLYCQGAGLDCSRAPGHGPVHLLLISAAEIGFDWDGQQQSWIRAAVPPLRMLAGPIQHFQSFFLRPGSSKFVLSAATGRGFGDGSFGMSEDLCNYLPLPTCRKEIKCC